MDLSDLEALLGESLETAAPRDVWVMLDGPAALPLLGRARLLADSLGAYVRAGLLSNDLSPQEAIACGADYAIPLSPTAPEDAPQALGALFVEHKPEVLLLPAGPGWNEAAARLAARLDGGLVTDAFNLRLDESTRAITASQWVYDGDDGLDLTVTAPTRIFTRGPARFPARYPDPNRFGEALPAPEDANRGPAPEPEPPAPQPAVIGPAEAFAPPPTPLRKARRIVSVGRAVKDEATLGLARALAARLDAHLAGDRGALDRGWIAPEQVIGVNGETVVPDLYFALGVRGDPAHDAGMEGARRIIAVHPDPAAPFLARADQAIVADPAEFLTALLQALG